MEREGIERVWCVFVLAIARCCSNSGFEYVGWFVGVGVRVEE